MNVRFLLVGTIAGALLLFAWQTFSEVVLPWHEATQRSFANDSAVVQAIQAGAPANGVYYSPRGVLAAVSIVPGVADKETLMGAMLVRQLVIDLVVMLLVCVLVTRLPVQSIVGSGITVAIGGLACALIIEASNWNWYGFSASFAAVNVVDQTIQFFLAGALGSLLARRLGPRPARTAEYVGVHAAGYGPPGARHTTAR